jgi:hypothetical protein
MLWSNATTFYLNDFMHKIYNFVKMPCVLCSFDLESIEHLFFSCRHPSELLIEINEWSCIKSPGFPRFTFHGIMLILVIPIITILLTLLLS